MIYFISTEDKKEVKIGFTDNIKKRLSSLQTGSPYKLIVLRVIPGGIEKERDIHKMFSEKKQRGEWFLMDNDISKYIESIEGDCLKYRLGLTEEADSNAGLINYYRKELKLTLRGLAEKLGVSKCSLKESEDREKAGTITINTLNKIANCMGYKVEYRFVRR